MHRTPILAGTLSMLLILVAVLTLAMGFGVEMAQALSQSAPIALATGIVVSVGTALLNQELA
jgi:hypothetical protein